jgi:hypothetical protein
MKRKEGEWKSNRGKKAKPRCKHFYSQCNWCKNCLKNHVDGNDKRPCKGIVPSAFSGSESAPSSSQNTTTASLLPPVLPSGVKRKRAQVVRLTQSQEDETRMRRKMELRERYQTSLSQVLRAGGILSNDKGLSGNRHRKDVSGLVRFSNGVEVTPAEFADLKEFLGLPRNAHKEDVESIAATYSAARRLQQKKAKIAEPTARKKITLLSFFTKGSTTGSGVPAKGRGVNGKASQEEQRRTS